MLLVGFLVYRAIKHPVSPKKRGVEMQQDSFKKVPVYQKLDTAVERLPIAVNLEAFCPARLDQGDQNSCVGWSSAYAARTILEAQASGKDPNTVAFSPSFLYNQIHLPDCAGCLMPDALRTLQEIGLLSLDEFPYNDQNCDQKPSDEQKKRAQRYRIPTFNRLTKSTTDITIDTLAIKQCLSKKSPIVIGVLMMESLENCDTSIWLPAANDRFVGGHAMCLIGYNDTLAGGCFRIMNSWGEDWADKGFIWIKYADFFRICREAYALAPLASRENKNHLKVSLSVFDTKANRPVGISNKGIFFFKNKQKDKLARKRAAIRVVVQNELDCYFYLLGQKNGKSVVLFPNSKTTHAAYLGLTGRRLFPTDDAVETKNWRKFSYFTAITGKNALNIDSLNRVLNQKKWQKTDPLLRAKRVLPDVSPSYFVGSAIGITDTLEQNKAVVRVIRLR